MTDATIHTLTMSNEILLGETKRLVSEGKEVTLRVRGISMRPFLEDRRDKIVLTKFTRTPQVGDPVLAEIAPGKYVYHRIIHIEKDKVTLKGDGNVRGTEQCHISHIVAATKHLIRKDKTYSPEDKVWRYYSVLWPNWGFLRRLLLAIYRRLPASWR